MADEPKKGRFEADIPADAVEAALRSVERPKGAADPAAAAEGVAVEVEGGAPPADAAEVASLRAQVELSQELGRKAQETLKDTHERLLRATADLENYKKRALREKEEVARFGAEKLLKDLLPVADNLDRALAAAPPNDPLADGVKLVRSALEQVLGRHGVKGFSAMHAPFDPARHEALMQVPTAEHPPGTVVLEHARGFTLHDRLLRPAMVGVAVAAPAATGEGQAASAGGGPADDGSNGGH